ncbi:MAG TPA: hypothetical protein VEW70_00405, partial [Burkholderiales bacterium]|nr:hypothetical protein [Burkholderiales bacterium]
MTFIATPRLGLLKMRKGFRFYRIGASRVIFAIRFALRSGPAGPRALGPRHDLADDAAPECDHAND